MENRRPLERGIVAVGRGLRGRGVGSGENVGVVEHDGEWLGE